MRELVQNFVKGVVLVNCLSFSCGSSADARESAQNMIVHPKRPALTEELAFDRLMQLVNSDSRLYGAWVVKRDLEPDPLNPANPYRYVLDLVVDQSRASQQEVELRNLLRRTPLDRSYRIGAVRQLPQSELISQVNLEIEARKDFDGCYVLGAIFTKPDISGQQVITLYGRVATPEQRLGLARACNQLMTQLRVWRKATENSGLNIATDPSGEYLVVMRPSPSSAEYFYAEGRNHFTEGRINEASQYFHNAVVESPGEQTYRYWRILSDLRLGRREKAYEHMWALVRRGEYSPSTEVYASLERIQGPLRMALVDLETNAKAGFKYVKYGNPHSRSSYESVGCACSIRDR